MDRRNENFNPAAPTVLHIDLNSCFATIEQQAKPLLRGRVMGVSPLGGEHGCVIAPSIEAKALGIKTGMRVWEAKKIYPKMVILPPDPYAYRYVHVKLREILKSYSPSVHPKSIDEFVVDLKGTQAFKRGMKVVAQEIKDRIKEEIGLYLTTSVGIANNRCLAKLAAGLHKPDGLDQIDITNYWDIYGSLDLKDLPGINVGYSRRLNIAGVYTIHDMYNRSLKELHAGFESVIGEDWYARLRGWEADDVEWSTKSFSNQRVIANPIIDPYQIQQVMMFLLWKTTSRMRIAGYQCRHYFFGFNVKGREERLPYFWSTHKRLPNYTFSSAEIFKYMKEQFSKEFGYEYITQVFVGVSELKGLSEVQLDILQDKIKDIALYKAVDMVEHKFGKNTLKPAIMLGTEGIASHRIPFNSTKEMEQYLFNGDEVPEEGVL